jgi:PTS system mannitol-specific IIC component
VAAFFIKRKSNTIVEEGLESAKERVMELKGKKFKQGVKKIVFACDAGMGSSAMGASTLRKKLEKAGIDVETVNSAIDQIPGDADIVISHSRLTQRAKATAPNAEHISIDNFIGSPVYDELVKRLSK